MSNLPSCLRAQPHCKANSFGCLYLRLHSFGHWPKLMTIAENWNADRLVNRSFAFWLSTLFIKKDHFNIHITAKSASIHLSISCSIFPSLMNKILKHLNSSTGSINSSPTKSHGLRFRGADPHPCRFSISSKLFQHKLEVTVQGGQQEQ